MKSKTAIIVLIAVLASVLLFSNGVNININHTFSFQLDDKPATMEEVILSLLEGEGQYGEPEVFLIQPNDGGYSDYGTTGRPQFFKDMQTSPSISIPSKKELERWNEMLIGPPLYELQPGDLGESSKKSSPPEPTTTEYDKAKALVDEVLEREREIPDPE